MTFPKEFLWGASTAAHQVEGNNLSSDWWQREHGHLASPHPIETPSGDAADSYHRYPQDMKLLADAGLTTYRFSIEWARIEPEPGYVSRAQIDHYRRMVDTARESGLTPMVTLHHFTSPAWLVRDVGWDSSRVVDLFARYVQLALPVLKDVELVCTINEPNMVAIMANSEEAFPHIGLPAGNPIVTEHLISAHQLAVAILRGAGKKAGWSVATQAYQSEPGAEEVAAEYGLSREDVFLDAATGDDWIGIQAYTRTKIGMAGPIAIPDDAERTLTGWEYYPGALEFGIRRSWERNNGVPIYVTENGIATADDQRRIDYTTGALEGVQSALDNHEWGSYAPTFGLIGWDPATFERHPKPSLGWLGKVARRNSL